jgi:hypothetical protein
MRRRDISKCCWRRRRGLLSPGAGPIANADPLNATPLAGGRITISLCNATGGGLVEVPWARAYQLDSWVSPAPGFSRSIDLRYNDKNWVEVARRPTDVPS